MRRMLTGVAKLHTAWLWCLLALSLVMVILGPALNRGDLSVAESMCIVSDAPQDEEFRVSFQLRNNAVQAITIVGASQP